MRDVNNNTSAYGTSAYVNNNTSAYGTSAYINNTLIVVWKWVYNREILSQSNLYNGR